MNLTAVDLFCGCGGLTRGLKNAGYQVLAGVDSWQAALDVYAANNTDHDWLRHDLSNEEETLAIVRKYAPSIIAGGPPCQDFSSAGSRLEGARADLTPKFARVVAAARPIAFIMENVSRAAHSEAYKVARSVYKEAGYGITQVVLDASLCGVPQKRKRLFMIGVLGDQDGFLDTLLAERQAKEPKTIRQYMGEEITFEHYYRHPRTYQRRAIHSIDEPSPTIRGVNRPMPATYNRHQNDTADPDPAVVAVMDFYLRSRVQTFPKDYVWPKSSKASLEQMIGNAVPVDLAMFVAKALGDYLSARPETTEASDGFLIAAE